MSAARPSAGTVPRGAFWRLLAGAALISTTSIFVRYAHVAPTVSAFYRVAFGGAMLVVLLTALRRWRGVGWRDAIWLLVPALAFAVDLMMWHRSIQLIGPGLATLIGNFQVFVMALAGVVFYHERLDWRFFAGVAMAMFGLWLLVGFDWHGLDAGYRFGIVLGVLTGIAYAVYMLSLRQAQLRRAQLTPERALCLLSLLCALMLALAVVAEGESFAIPDTQSWLALLALAFIGQVLGWVLIAQAMPQLPASLVGLLLLLQPALSFVLDVLLFARATTALAWFGLALSLLGIFVASQRKTA
ncbi:MAG TPA: DMT family transporter [Rudaea sp.]|jgi:drug/metabolite transporter (DMT)-like permease|uniref:DMT family transporter n=1 Tax=Rudaea sp. TaxID=2136325 RepID=UPI002F92D229